MAEPGAGQNIKPMEVKSVSLDRGVAQVSIKDKEGKVTGNYVPAWHMTIRTPKEDYYNLELLPPGIAGTLSGLSRDNWHQRDTLLSLDKDENNNGSYRTRAITTEEAKQIRGVLQDIREGKRVVSESLLTTDDNLSAYERQHPPKEVDKEFSNQVVSFLEPRIEVAAENLDEMAKVPLGLVDDRLGEKRELDRPSRL